MRAFIHNLFFLILSTVISSLSLLSGLASAASYDVTASVDFPAPTQAAVIAGGLNGTTVDSASLVISGTCEVLLPNGVVSIWRSGVAIGSAPCTGTFSVTVTLQEGSNVLVARSASVSNQYGPDSSQVTVTLALPAPSVAPTPSPGSPGATDEVSQNAGAASGLSATPAQAFSSIGSDKVVVLMVVVVGGATPYTIYINWGDGTEESRTVDQPGTYQFDHTYSKDGSYLVKGVVRDVLGATTSFEYAVVSQKPAPTAAAKDTEKAGAIIETNNAILAIVLYVGIGAVITAFGYALGMIRAGNLASAGSTPPSPVISKKKTSTPGEKRP